MANDRRGERGSGSTGNDGRHGNTTSEPHPTTMRDAHYKRHPVHGGTTPRTVSSIQQSDGSRAKIAPTSDADAVAQGFLGASAPPSAAPTWKRRLYIDRPADLAALAADLAATTIIAIDAEFSQVRSPGPQEFSHRLALLQIACDNDFAASYVIDTLRLSDLSPLRIALEKPDILKLFHGIGADARVLATRGLIARHTLDLEAVSRAIFGQRESGLQTMLMRACGIRLDKSLQRADWSRRPLTSAMVAYAAHDAEMTLVLHTWLSAHYAWAVSLYETPADEPLPAVAPWILPYLEGSRPRPAVLAVAEAGLSEDIRAQERAAREALTAVRRPNHRARVIRLITDLELASLAPDLRAHLTAPAAEERASAARALGRLRDSDAAPLLQPLLDDPVQDVRQAARLALDNLKAPPRAPRTSRLAKAPTSRGAAVARDPQKPSGARVHWTSEATEHDASTDESGWRAALRATFGIAEQPSDQKPDPVDEDR